MIRIGFIDSNTYSKFSQFNVTKQDISDAVNTNLLIHKRGTSSYNLINRIAVNLDLDFLTPSLLTSIRTNLYESWTYPKIFMKHPSSAANQIIDFNGITSPSITSSVYYLDSDDSNATWTDGTEITAYSAISNIDNLAYNNYGSHAYNYLFLNFANAIDPATNPIQRVSLMLHNPYCYTTTNQSFTIEVLNQVTNVWMEVSRCNYVPYSSYTTIAPNDYKIYQHFAVLKPNNNTYSQMIDYTSGDNFYHFRMRNINSAASNTNMGFNFACLLIDGFPISFTGTNNFSYRSEFTGQGEMGKLSFTELS